MSGPSFHAACATVLEAIAAASESGAACPSNADLAAMAGLGSVTGVTRAFAELEARGMIVVHQRSNRRQVTVVATGMSTAPIGTGRVSGEELAADVRAAAQAAGRPLREFAAPLSSDPLGWLDQLSRAREPRAHTVARIRALIAGGEIPPPIGNNFLHRVSARRGVPRDRSPAELQAETDHLVRVSRDPCGSCGARGDYGCGCHRPQKRIPYRPDPTITLGGVGSAML